MGTRYAHMDTLGTTTRHIAPAGEKVGADQLTRPALVVGNDADCLIIQGEPGDLVTLAADLQLTAERFAQRDGRPGSRFYTVTGLVDSDTGELHIATVLLGAHVHVDETTYSGRYDQLTRFSVTVMATDPDHAEILAQRHHSAKWAA